MKPINTRKVVAAGAIGNVLEWYDFAIYGYLPVALTFSVTAMAVPTFLIGVLPGYATLGVMAPIALTFLRMVQGVSVGGEYTTSIVFMVENAPPGRRGFVGALACCGAVGGILFGSA